uniref:Uncharacterized protein n=1 Tax=Timema genevievae TaxID=629358 RepID=A0A7R9JXP1_TIMGE|nr:unnamed protein product [Timema genevievae]
MGRSWLNSGQSSKMQFGREVSLMVAAMLVAMATTTPAETTQDLVDSHMRNLQQNRRIVQMLRDLLVQLDGDMETVHPTSAMVQITALQAIAEKLWFNSQWGRSFRLHMVRKQTAILLFRSSLDTNKYPRSSHTVIILYTYGARTVAVSYCRDCPVHRDRRYDVCPPQELVSPTKPYNSPSPPESSAVKRSECIVVLLITMSDTLSSSSDEDIVVAAMLLE